MLDEALATGTPEVFNTDQGVQFTAAAWVERVEAAGVWVSTDGRCRCLDNVFVEFLWGYESVPGLERGLKTPAEVYRAGRSEEPAREKQSIAGYWSRNRGPLQTA